MIEHDPTQTTPETTRDLRQEAIDSYFPAWDLLDDAQKGELIAQFHLDEQFAGSPVAQVATDVSAAFIAQGHANWKEAIQGVALALAMLSRAWHRAVAGHDLPPDAQRVLASYGEGLNASVARSFEGTEGGVLAARMFVQSAMLASFGDSLVRKSEDEAPQILVPEKGIILP